MAGPAEPLMKQADLVSVETRIIPITLQDFKELQALLLSDVGGQLQFALKYVF